MKETGVTHKSPIGVLILCKPAQGPLERIDWAVDERRLMDRVLAKNNIWIDRDVKKQLKRNHHGGRQ